MPGCPSGWTTSPASASSPVTSPSSSSRPASSASPRTPRSSRARCPTASSTPTRSPSSSSPGRASTTPSSRSPPPTSSSACDVLRGVYDATDGQDGRVSIEVDPGAARDTERTIELAEKLWRPRRPPEPVHQDPGHRGRTAGDHRDDRQGHQRQRHADLLPRPLPRRHGRLPGRARAGRRARPRPRRHPVRGVVLRQPGRHRDRQAARRRHPLRGKAAIANARLAYEQYEKVVGSPRFRSWPRRAPTPSVRSGRPPASRTRPTRTRCTSASSSSPTPSTRCPRRRWRPSPTTARSEATPCTAPTTTRATSSRHSSATASATTTSSPSSRREGVDKFDTSWAELLDTVSNELDKA